MLESIIIESTMLESIIIESTMLESIMTESTMAYDRKLKILRDCLKVTR